MTTTSPAPELLFGNGPVPPPGGPAKGRLSRVFGDEFYVIDDAREMKPFLMSIVSDSDHWLFVGSNGALTAGRRHPGQALFPYVTEDKLYDSVGVTGPSTTLVVSGAGQRRLWHPLAHGDALVYRTRRRLYKNVTGNRLVFEEANLDLGLSFRYEWRTSHRFGIVRECTLHNEGDMPVEIRVLDGLLNILPADVDEQLQRSASCLIDAYKKNELVAGSTLALYTLAAQVIDRAEPRESLHATTVWSHGLGSPAIHLGDDVLARFDLGLETPPVDEVRGRRGAYFVDGAFSLPASAERSWIFVADLAQTQADVALLRVRLDQPAELVDDLWADVARGDQELRRIVIATDGLQLTADRRACVHHFSNVLFNDLRGGVFVSGNTVPGRDLAASIRRSSPATWTRHLPFLTSLGEHEPRGALLERVIELKDPDLERLASEYLPLFFSRRHADPSRPWNRFDIRVKDEQGDPLLGYEGNWRDIFQNWEALCLSYPDFVEHAIARFLNASTADGYNPYRITNEGIDWEVPEPEHPWSSIGYWGDHQIVYLLRLLELSLAHHPERLPALLEREIFAYADVPYVIKPYPELIRDPRSTIVFDAEKQARIAARSGEQGEDAKLLQDDSGVCRVNLVEKLLVPALAKLANFVPGGGIWLNTQRPEWNDANNALVGYGLSVVTLCYLERYLVFVGALLAPLAGRTVALSREVAAWLKGTLDALEAHRGLLGASRVDDRERGRLMDALGTTASQYREAIYGAGLSEKIAVPADKLLELAALGGAFARHTINLNRRPDGLYHAYNLLVPGGPEQGFGIEYLYEMLEGQVAALSSPSLEAAEADEVLAALPTSRLYRADQDSYLLYPDRRLPAFLDKNVIPEEAIATSALLSDLLARGDERIVVRDARERIRFHPDFSNAQRCREALEALRARGELPQATDDEVDRVLEIYELVFHHHSFTGRSGTMFAYEGLGSIYWHMVGKLLVAVQERFAAAADVGESPGTLARLAERYEAIRAGLAGVEKSPAVYGAFPLDPYSHSPAHAGAKQPGMTGQVKEEILTRRGELGVRVREGAIAFEPLLLRRQEFLEEPSTFWPLDVDHKPVRIELEPDTLAFTIYQVPVVYHLSAERRIVVTEEGGGTRDISGATLDPETSAAIFRRTGRVRRLDVFTQAGRGDPTRN